MNMEFKRKLPIPKDIKEMLSLEDASQVKQIADNLQNKYPNCLIFVMSATESKVVFVGHQNLSRYRGISHNSDKLLPRSGTAISNGNVQRVWDASQQVDACEAH